MRAAFVSIKLFSFFWMVLGTPGFCPLHGAAGAHSSHQPPALEGIQGASVPVSSVGCEGLAEGPWL